MAAGALIYLMVVLGMVLMWYFDVLLSSPSRAREILYKAKPWFHLTRTIYTGLGSATLIGMCVGWITFYHRLPWLLGGRKVNNGVYVLAAFAVLLNLPFSLILLPGIAIIYLQRYLRANSSVHANTPAGYAMVLPGILTVLYFAAGMLLAALFFGTDRNHTPSGEEIAFSLTAMLVAGLCIGDCVFAMLVSAWRKQNRALPPPERYQFTLASFMFSTMTVGLWVTGLFWFFQKKPPH